MVNQVCSPASWSVHHFKVLTYNLSTLRDLFVERFLFRESQSSTCGRAVVVERGDARFLLEEIDDKSISEGVSDIVLESSSVDSLVNKIASGGGEIIQNPFNEVSEDGVVRKAVVQSIIPSICHTIIDTSAYKGQFLPNFESPKAESDHDLSSPALNSIRIDHIAIACEEGDSKAVIDWYERCFGMRRFLVNAGETLDEGFIVQHGQAAMRLKALNYWRCMESGISSNQENDFKIVLAEPLSFSGPNQISTFLRENNGPGVQHIALLTDDIISVAKSMQSAGLELMRPPDAYYEEVGELQVENSVETPTFISDIAINNLKDSCILIDIEVAENKSKIEDIPELSVEPNILYQVFTKTLFEKDTFFMELIQRNGATGFGAANIKALWRALGIYLKHE